MQSMNRRTFLQLIAATSGSAVIVSGCSLSKRSLTPAQFTHGVASGDPTSQSVMLWTRAEPADGSIGPVAVTMQLSTDREFSQVVRTQTIETSASRDYTVKTDVVGLTPNTPYFYRFQSANGYSMVGTTRTLPSAGLEEVTFGVVSCSNYPAGYYNVYHALANDSSIDIVLHLGDYIYEYAADGYATERAAELGRQYADDNAEEIISLNDYRKRYAINRSDEHLQAAHANHPFIVVWDDHEITNDTYISGAENHDPSEGDFFARRAAAVQAYYEWMPIRPPQGDANLAIYRSFDFGDLLSLHMLDTRVIGRQQQLAFKDFYATDGNFDPYAFASQVNDAKRQLLGVEQMAWLEQQLRNSSANWQVLGQQVLMSKMEVPVEVVQSIYSKDVGSVLQELVELRLQEARGKTLSERDAARLSRKMAFNLDAWDGYAAQREAIYQLSSSLNKNLVAFAGDTHNAWYSTLTDMQGKLCGHEFATSSVSSPGLETYLGLDERTAPQVARGLELLIDDLKYCNVHQRGYMKTRFTATTATTTWHYVDTIWDKNYQITDSSPVTISIS